MGRVFVGPHRNFGDPHVTSRVSAPPLNLQQAPNDRFRKRRLPPPYSSESKPFYPFW
jgi:hypothetical protein